MTAPAWPAGWTAGIVGCGSAGSRAARLLLDLGVPAAALHGYDLGLPAAGWPAPARAWSLAIRPGDAPLPLTTRHDVWLVCTPPSARLYYYRALLAGRPAALFAEKPLGEVDALAALRDAGAEAAAHDTVTQVGYCWRWHPVAAAARAWLARRPLGTVTAAAVCAVDMGSWPGAGYGAPLLECSHELDLLLYCLGPAATTWASARVGHDTLVLRHRLGATSTLTLLPRYGGGYYRGLTLLADDGIFRWATTDFNDPGRVETQSRAEGLAERDLNPAGRTWHSDDMYRAQYADFLRAAIGGAAVRCSWRDGLAVLRVLQQASAASRWESAGA